MTNNRYIVRPATPEDKQELTGVIHASARGLSTSDYSQEQIDALITGVYGVDSALVEDGTYFAVEDIETKALVGCGGWSKRLTMFGGDQYSGPRNDGYADPSTHPAKIRALFVHPEYARIGIATAILDRCESEAIAAGFRTLELMSTMPGFKFYLRHGYTPLGQATYKFVGVDVELEPMRKIVLEKDEDESVATCL